MSKLRYWHRILALICGVQLLIWTLSGAYMVLTDIHWIRGSTLITAPTYSFNAEQVQLDLPSPSATLIAGVRGPLYLLKQQPRQAIDATNGDTLTPLSENQARTIAQQSLNASIPIASAQLITSAPPAELGNRPLPIWAVEFEGIAQPTLYLDGYSGQLLTQRHFYWRLFDWMWRLHIIDYSNLYGPKTPWLSAISLLSLLLFIVGIGLVKRR